MSGFKNDITLGKLLGLLGYNDNNAEQLGTRTKEIEVELASLKFLGENKVYALDDIPMDLHNRRVFEIEAKEGRPLIVHLDNFEHPSNINLTLRQRLQFLNPHFQYRLKFKNYVITDDTFLYENAEAIPEKLMEVEVVKTKVKHMLEKDYAHRYTYVITLNCAPPPEYKFYEQH